MEIFFVFIFRVLHALNCRPVEFMLTQRERERDFITTRTSARHDTTHKGEMRKKENNGVKNSYLEN